MLKNQSVITIAVTAKEPICEGTLVCADGHIARANSIVFGICGQDVETEQSFPCHCIGVFEVMAGDFIQAGEWLGANDLGRAISSGLKPFARALMDAEKGENVLVCAMW